MRGFLGISYTGDLEYVSDVQIDGDITLGTRWQSGSEKLTTETYSIDKSPKHQNKVLDSKYVNRNIVLRLWNAPDFDTS